MFVNRVRRIREVPDTREAMVVRLVLALALAGLLSFWPARAAAQTTVTLDRPGEKTCVSEQELAAALSRAGLAVTPPASQVPDRRVWVTVTGAPVSLTVALRGDWSQTIERLSPATCETATDVVAAFVVSTPAGLAISPRPRRQPGATGRLRRRSSGCRPRA
jgi:hypothetical protein